MSVKIKRSVYADMFGPTTGDRVRLADTDLIIEVEKDFTTYGEEVKFGGGKVIRDGMGQSQATNKQGAADTVITNALIVDHWGIVKADVAIKEGLYQRHRQGRQSRHPARRHHRHRPRHRHHRRRRQNPHRGRLRQPHPFHLPAADRTCLMSGVTSMLGGGTGPFARHLCHHLHARPLAHGADDPVVRCVPGQSRHFRQGQCLASGGAGGDDQGRRLRLETARGLGHHAGRDRQLPVGGRRLRRPGDDPLGYAERKRLRRGHRQGVQGPHHPRLPHRRRRRRPRAGHHQDRRA